jgi:hypothetical protein
MSEGRKKVFSQDLGHCPCLWGVLGRGSFVQRVRRGRHIFLGSRVVDPSDGVVSLSHLFSFLLKPGDAHLRQRSSGIVHRINLGVCLG